MKIYPIEKELGLEEAIKASLSIPVVAEICEAPNLELDKEALKSLDIKAGVEDFDIYRVFSILVSTVWNKNDDVFDKYEVWKARETPRFKKINIDHDEKQIVGAITDVWPVNADYELIANDIAMDDLPDLYHLLVSSVIYTTWEDKDFEKKVAQLIEKIESGDKYVSMECLIRGFDYAVITPDGEQRVLPRTAETAFLTSKLRCYGGDGVYEDHRIGRLVRNIVFSGKGFVDRPANPDSIIFDKNENFAFAGEIGVDNFRVNFDIKSTKENTMSDNILQDQLKELKDSLAAVQSENDELKEQLAKANVSAYEGRIGDLEEQVSALEKQRDEVADELKAATEKNTELEAQVKSLQEELEAAKSELDKMKDEQKKKERSEKMAKAGLDEKEISEKLDLFASLSDEQFDAIVDTLSKAVKVEADEEDEDEEVEASVEDVVNEDEEKQETVSASSDTEEDELSEVRAGLQKWVETLISK